MFISIEWEAQDAALELEENTISNKDSVKIILKQFNKVY